jgi:hypothetical protein
LFPLIYLFSPYDGVYLVILLLYLRSCWDVDDMHLQRTVVREKVEYSPFSKENEGRLMILAYLPYLFTSAYMYCIYISCSRGVVKMVAVHVTTNACAIHHWNQQFKNSLILHKR